MLAIGTASIPAGAVIDCIQQSTVTRPIELGVSGGNINSFIQSNQGEFCSSGTLGSMVQDQSTNKFILSNNHVLADINLATPGQLIVQPGLADTACDEIPSDAVATFSRTVNINFGGKNTIDAAIAAVNAGDVSADILNIGPIASSAATPTIGLAVQKMGRTTCLTTGRITAVRVKAKISYYTGGKTKQAKFVDQILISVPNFSGAGDSGSLIVTQDSCPQAVALLFAGSSDQSQTLANPISAVLSGLNVSMVGGCTSAAAPETPQTDLEADNVGMSKEVAEAATAVRDRHENELMSIAGAVGTGIGIGDQPGQAAIEVYVRKLRPQEQAALPKEVEGIPVKLIENGGFVAY
ncbi:MAG: hypothetical protein WCA22_21905 [Candidatus Binatus sp.]